jgi:hypothetical protein
MHRGTDCVVPRRRRQGARRADTTTGAAGAAPPHLTILFDNYHGLPELTSLWGFAALIRAAGRTILFDTGSNGRVLLKNMAVLGHMPESVDLVVQIENPDTVS